MSKAVKQGGNSFVAYRMSADHTTIYGGSTGTTAALAMANCLAKFGSAVAGDEDIVVNSDFAPADDGTVAFKSAVTKLNEETDTFLNVVAPNAATGAPAVAMEELTSEDGSVKIGGATAGGGGVDILLISHGGIVGTNRLCTIGIYRFKKTSGGFQLASGKYAQVGLEAVTVAAIAEVSIPAALFDAAKVTIATPQVLPINTYFKRLFLPKAA